MITITFDLGGMLRKCRHHITVTRPNFGTQDVGSTSCTHALCTYTHHAVGDTLREEPQSYTVVCFRGRISACTLDDVLYWYVQPSTPREPPDAFSHSRLAEALRVASAQPPAKSALKCTVLPRDGLCQRASGIQKPNLQPYPCALVTAL